MSLVVACKWSVCRMKGLRGEKSDLRTLASSPALARMHAQGGEHWPLHPRANARSIESLAFATHIRHELSGAEHTSSCLSCQLPSTFAQSGSPIPT